MSDTDSQTQAAFIDEVIEALDTAGESIRGVLHRPLGALTAADLYRVHGELSVPRSLFTGHRG